MKISNFCIKIFLCLWLQHIRKKIICWWINYCLSGLVGTNKWFMSSVVDPEPFFKDPCLFRGIQIQIPENMPKNRYRIFILKVGKRKGEVGKIIHLAQAGINYVHTSAYHTHILSVFTLYFCLLKLSVVKGGRIQVNF